MSREIVPTEPKRVRSFALFFKNYMSISTLIVAALPVPVTSLDLIPTFAAQTKLFSVYTSPNTAAGYKQRGFELGFEEIFRRCSR